MMKFKNEIQVTGSPTQCGWVEFILPDQNVHVRINNKDTKEDIRRRIKFALST